MYESFPDLQMRVIEGRFELIGPDKQIILHSLWERSVQPGWEVTLLMPPDFRPDPLLDPYFMPMLQSTPSRKARKRTKGKGREGIHPIEPPSSSAFSDVPIRGGCSRSPSTPDYPLDHEVLKSRIGPSHELRLDSGSGGEESRTGIHELKGMVGNRILRPGHEVRKYQHSPISDVEDLSSGTRSRANLPTAPHVPKSTAFSMSSSKESLTSDYSNSEGGVVLT